MPKKLKEVPTLLQIAAKQLDKSYFMHSNQLQLWEQLPDELKEVLLENTYSFFYCQYFQKSGDPQLLEISVRILSKKTHLAEDLLKINNDAEILIISFINQTKLLPPETMQQWLLTLETLIAQPDIGDDKRSIFLACYVLFFKTLHPEKSEKITLKLQQLIVCGQGHPILLNTLLALITQKTENSKLVTENCLNQLLKDLSSTDTKIKLAAVKTLLLLNFFTPTIRQKIHESLCKWIGEDLKESNNITESILSLYEKISPFNESENDDLIKAVIKSSTKKNYYIYFDLHRNLLSHLSPEDIVKLRSLLLKQYNAHHEFRDRYKYLDQIAIEFLPADEQEFAYTTSPYKTPETATPSIKSDAEKLEDFFLEAKEKGVFSQQIFRVLHHFKKLDEDKINLYLAQIIEMLNSANKDTRNSAVEILSSIKKNIPQDQMPLIVAVFLGGLTHDTITKHDVLFAAKIFKHFDADEQHQVLTEINLVFNNQKLQHAIRTLYLSKHIPIAALKSTVPLILHAFQIKGKFYSPFDHLEILLRVAPALNTEECSTIMHLVLNVFMTSIADYVWRDHSKTFYDLCSAIIDKFPDQDRKVFVSNFISSFHHTLIAGTDGAAFTNFFHKLQPAEREEALSKINWLHFSANFSVLKVLLPTLEIEERKILLLKFASNLSNADSSYQDNVLNLFSSLAPLLTLEETQLILSHLPHNNLTTNFYHQLISVDTKINDDDLSIDLMTVLTRAQNLYQAWNQKQWGANIGEKKFGNGLKHGAAGQQRALRLVNSCKDKDFPDMLTEFGKYLNNDKSYESGFFSATTQANAHSFVTFFLRLLDNADSLPNTTTKALYGDQPEKIKLASQHLKVFFENHGFEFKDKSAPLEEHSKAAEIRRKDLLTGLKLVVVEPEVSAGKFSSYRKLQ